MSNLDTPNELDQLLDQQPQISRPLALGAAALASAALAACGGGGGADSTASVTPSNTLPGDTNLTPVAMLVDGSKLAREDAWRFLNQATMGPSEADINYITNNGIDAWLNAQLAMKPTQAFVKRFYELFNQSDKPNKDNPSPELVRTTWWRGALTGKDQLRQRVAFALSEILVVSFKNMTIQAWPLLGAQWADLLHKNAFGDFRSLIRDVVYSPAMGWYLSHFANIRPNDAGQRPDQNFARELLQLFTTGLVKLYDDDGSIVMSDKRAVPASTTAATDVRVLSHVFVGLAWPAPYGYDGFPASKADPVMAQDMAIYQNRACTHADLITKSLTANEVARLTPKNTDGSPMLVPGTTQPQVMLLGKPFYIVDGDLSATINKALDIILAHDNVAPFIAKQMIQRLVTSNPTSNYVSRTAQVFRTSGLNLGSLVYAILTDEEATGRGNAQSDDTYGKVREPLLRVTHLLRAFNAKALGTEASYWVAPWADNSSTFVTNNKDNPWRALAQAPLSAVNVFNYFSPSFRAPASNAAGRGLVTPEMQITTETSVASYINAIDDILARGFFDWWDSNGDGVIDGTPIAIDGTLPAQMPAHMPSTVTTTDQKVVWHVNNRLMGLTMSSQLQTYLLDTLSKVGSALSTEQRVKLVILMTMAAPEYIVQK